MMRMVLEFVFRSALIAAGTAAVLRVLRVRSAGARHAAWAAVMVQMLLLPLWISWGPKASLRLLPAAAAPPDSRAGVSASTAGNPGAGSHDVALIADSFTPVPSRGGGWSAFGVVYLLGAGILFWRLAFGTDRARRLIGTTFPVNGRLTSKRCAAPVTVGWLRPVVILPEGWREWPEEQLAAVLAHEQAHVRRRDPLVQWMALLNRALFWFHPLAWYLERRLSGLAEEACDAAVLAEGHDPYEYSRCLLRMAETVVRSGVRVEALGMAMPGSYLGYRIRQILEGGYTRRLTGPRIVAAICACSLMSGLFAAAAVDRKTPEPAVTFAMPVLAPPQPLPSVPSSPLPGPPSAPVAKPAPKPVLVAQVRNTPAQDQLQQNQRLLVFYLDLVQMTPDDLGRAVAAAENFLRERVQEQDHITLMTHSSTTVHVDITQDRDRLVQELRRLTAPPNAAGEPPPQSNPVLIRQAIQVLAAMPDKKVILFFTHAPDNSGTREELQAAQDDAVRGKVAIYVIDTRGVVSPPK